MTSDLTKTSFFFLPPVSIIYLAMKNSFRFAHLFYQVSRLAYENNLACPLTSDCKYVNEEMSFGFDFDYVHLFRNIIIMILVIIMIIKTEKTVRQSLSHFRLTGRNAMQGAP